MATRSLFDQFAEGFGKAVSDVRDKLIEEAWFGRHTVPCDHAAPEMGQGGEGAPFSTHHEEAAPTAAAEIPTTWRALREHMSHTYGHGVASARVPDHEPERGIDR